GNDLLFDRISQELKKQANAEIKTEDGLKWCAMPLPVPPPFSVELTVASSGDYFYLASSPDLIRRIQQVRAGKSPSLRSTPEYQKLAAQLPKDGNQFVFTS